MTMASAREYKAFPQSVETLAENYERLHESDPSREVIRPPVTAMPREDEK